MVEYLDRCKASPFGKADRIIVMIRDHFPVVIIGLRSQQTSNSKVRMLRVKSPIGNTWVFDLDRMKTVVHWQVFAVESLLALHVISSANEYIWSESFLPEPTLPD
jgi:hypothetical protein